jgi:2-(1,2-epoxy-1,2-dihydrophenyl)acetyl-CoA isomerase
MTWSTIEVEAADAVGYVRFNRPERRNSVTAEMVTEIHQALSELAERDDLAVLVLTGNGSTFCPGADLGAAAERSGPMELPEIEMYQSARLLHEMPQLTIAAINGGCAGAGFSWASACDLRVAAAGAHFATSFLEVGLAGELGLAWTLQRSIGGARARELCFLPRKFDAAEAWSIGFVARILPDDSFGDDIAALASELIARSPQAVRTMKQNFLDAERLRLGPFIEVEMRRHLGAFQGEAGATSMARLAEQAARVHHEVESD